MKLDDGAPLIADPPLVPLVTDPPGGNSTSRQNQPICESSLNIALTLKQIMPFYIMFLFDL